MSTDINGLLSTFKTNMMNNGITVESNDRFKSLIDKIATMVEEGSNKGIKFAEGIHDPTDYIYNTDYDIETNLDFTPTLVFCVISDYVCTDANQYQNYVISNFTQTDTHSGYSICYIKNVTASKFTLHTFNSNRYIQINGRDSNVTLHWYAIGVGEEDTTLRDSLASILTEEGVSVTEEDDMASLIGKVDSEFSKDNNTINNLTNELAGKVAPAGTAVAGDVLTGKTFINSTGQVVTGTMANRGAKTFTPSASKQTGAAGYYSGITVNTDSNLVAANIVSGKKIFGVTGTAKSSSSLATTGDVSKTSTTYTNCVQLILKSTPLITVSSQSSTITEKYKFTSTVSGRIALLMNFSNQSTGTAAANVIFHIYKNGSLITSLTQVQVSGIGWIHPSSTPGDNVNCFVNLVSDTFTVAKNDTISIRVETYGSGWGSSGHIAKCYSIAVLGVFA